LRTIARAREFVRRLRDLLHRFVDGDTAVLAAMAPVIKEILSLYPVHIEKEDKEFFFPVLGYLTKEEQKKMLSTSGNREFAASQTVPHDGRADGRKT